MSEVLEKDVDQIGHNQPPSEFKLLEDQVNTFLKTADLWLTERPSFSDQDTARKAEDFDDQLKKLIKKVEGAEEVEKRPLMNSLDEIRGRFKSLSNRIKDVRGLFKTRREAWLKAEDARIAAERRKAEEEARAAQEEAERLRREAEKTAAKADAGELKGSGVSVTESLASAAEAEEAAAKAQAEYEAAQKQKAQVRGDYGSRSTGLKVRYVGKVIDNGKLLAWVKRNRADDLNAFLQGYADRAARSPEMRKSGLPGVEFVAEKHL